MDAAQLKKSIQEKGDSELVQFHVEDLRELLNLHEGMMHQVAFMRGVIHALADKHILTVKMAEFDKISEDARAFCEFHMDVDSAEDFFLKTYDVTIDGTTKDVTIDPYEERYRARDKSLINCEFKPSQGQELKPRPKNKGSWEESFRQTLRAEENEFHVHFNEPIRGVQIPPEPIRVRNYVRPDAAPQEPRLVWHIVPQEVPYPEPPLEAPAVQEPAFARVAPANPYDHVNPYDRPIRLNGRWVR